MLCSSIGFSISCPVVIPGPLPGAEVVLDLPFGNFVPMLIL